jgi:chitodextrinase
MPERRHNRLRLRALAMAAALTTALLGAPLAAGPAHAATLATGQQLAVPAYIYPSGTGATQWAQIASAGSSVGMTIANVYNGPSNSVDSNWATAIHNAHAAGVKVYGYVDTGYLGTTGRLTRLRDTSVAAWLAQTETDVNAWYQLYGSDIDGIFFDDATNVCGATTGTTTYSDLYKQLSDYVKQRHSGALTVDNPGTDVPQCYENSADVLLTFEGSYASYTSYAPSSWESGYDPHKFMNLIYSTSSTQMANAITLSKNNGVGYVYVTDGALSNPWNVLPSYWSSELAALPVTSTGTPATPAKPTAAAVTGTSVDVSWTSASWPAVVGYDVYRNGVQVGEVTNYTPDATDYTVGGLSPSTSYSFTVKARDYAGDVSAASAALTVSTSAVGATAPTAPTGLTAGNLQPNSVQLSWTASTAGSNPLAFYDVYQNGTWILSVPATQTTARFDGLTPGTTYTYTVLALDTSGHSSAQSSGITVTAPVPASDISAAASTLTSTTATYTATYNLEYNSHIVCIDSDNVSTTGYELTFSTGNVGCDYMIEDDALYKYAGSGTDWTWTQQTTVPVETVSGNTYSWQIPATALGTHATTEKVVFNGSGYSAGAWGSVVTVTQQ